MKKNKMVVSSDDEAEAQFHSVSNYHLEDDDRLPVSFAVLPIQWGEAEISDVTKEQVFLHGFADKALQVMVQVTAWRFDLSNAKPEISLLSSKDKTWIKLQKPRNSFQDTLRTILVTVHLLHRVKKNPNISSKSVWDNLFKDKELSSYMLKPSQKDLLDHMSLIGEAAKRDAVLAKSKVLLAVLKDKLGNKKLSDEEVKDLIQPADDGMENEAEEESKAKVDLSVCAICDDGGDLLSCDGPCMRSFHGTKEDGGDSNCGSLGLTQKDIEGIKSFYCKNCEYNQHQCFACGKLGYSGKVKDAEVIKCAYANCEHFYHPHCVPKVPSKVVEHVAEELERNVADSNSFTCPVHYCCVCKEVENTEEPELQFAVCRRCPKSYHRKCLPREIAFDDTDEDIVTRAWDGLLTNNRILIYCLNHEIDEELGTPVRNHIKFPNIKATVQNINATNEKIKSGSKQRVKSNKNNVDPHNPSGKSTAEGSKVTGKLSSGKVGNKEYSEKAISGSNISTKPKANGTSRSLTKEKASISKKSEMPDPKQTKPNNQIIIAIHKTLSKSDEPGSVDANGRLTDQSNGMPSGLSYGSHSDGTTKHQVTNPEHSNLSTQHEVSKMESCNTETLPADHTMDGNNDDHLTWSHELLKSTDDREDQPSKDVGKKRSSPNGNVGQESQAGKKHKMGKSNKTPLKKKHTEENEGRGCGVVSPAKRLNEKLERVPGQEDDQEDQPSKDVSKKRSSPNGNVGQESQARKKHKMSKSDKTPLKKHTEENEGRGCGVVSPAKTQAVNEKLERVPGQEDDREDQPSKDVSKKRSSPNGNVGQEIQAGKKHKMSNSDKTPLKKKNTKENEGRGCGVISPAKRQAVNEKLERVPGQEDDREDQPSKDVGKRRSSPNGNVGQESQAGKKHKMSKSGKTSLKKKHTEENDGRGRGVVSPAKRQAVNEKLEGVPGQEDDQEDQPSLDRGKKRSLPNGIVDQENQEEKNCKMSESGKTSPKMKRTKENNGRGRGVVSPAKRQAVNKKLEGVPALSQANTIDGRSSVEGNQLKSAAASPHVAVGDDGDQHLEPIRESGTTCNGIEKGPSVACPLSNIEEQHSREEEKSLTESDSRRSAYLSGLARSCQLMGNVGRSCTSDSKVPQSGYVDRLLGFAPCLNLAYSRRHSAGWLDE